MSDLGGYAQNLYEESIQKQSVLSEIIVIDNDQGICLNTNLDMWI